jgi:hypothetical protein
MATAYARRRAAVLPHSVALVAIRIPVGHAHGGWERSAGVHGRGSLCDAAQ